MADLRTKFNSLFSPQNPQKNNALPPKAHFSIWYFLVAFLIFALIQQYFLFQKVETIPYSQFKQHLVDGKVVKLTIGPEDISGTLKGKEKKPGQDFTTIRVNDPDLVKDLDAHKINYSGHYESKFMSRVMNPQEKEIVSFHESGHAIVAESVEHADPVHKISIIPRGIAALGYTQQQPTEDRYLMTRPGERHGQWDAQRRRGRASGQPGFRQYQSSFCRL